MNKPKCEFFKAEDFATLGLGKTFSEAIATTANEKIERECDSWYAGKNGIEFRIYGNKPCDHIQEVVKVETGESFKYKIISGKCQKCGEEIQ